MKQYESDLDNLETCVGVDSLGRRRTIHFDPQKHDMAMWGLVGPVPRRKFPHPAYALGYAMAVSYEYQMILIDLFTRREWPDYILELAGGLSFPHQDASTKTYQGMVAFESAIADSVKSLRPELAEAVAPFAARHGLNVLPWGLGWLYHSVPRKWTDNGVEVPVTLPPITSERRPTDPRTQPPLDALILYLWLTGGWRDQGAKDILRPVFCFECDVRDSPQCPKRVCFASGNVRPEALKRRINRIKSELDVHRPKGRPKGSSRWDTEELRFVLTEYISYWAFQREIANQ